MALQQVTDYENNNNYKKNPNIQKKSARWKFWGHLNHKFFSENIIYDPLNAPFGPMGAINIKRTGMFSGIGNQ